MIILDGSDDNGVKVLEFIQPSIWYSEVINSSKFNILDLHVFNRWLLVSFTAASHTPPKWGAYGVMQCWFFDSKKNLELHIHSGTGIAASTD